MLFLKPLDGSIAPEELHCLTLRFSRINIFIKWQFKNKSTVWNQNADQFSHEEKEFVKSWRKSRKTVFVAFERLRLFKCLRAERGKKRTEWHANTVNPPGRTNPRRKVTVSAVVLEKQLNRMFQGRKTLQKYLPFIMNKSHVINTLRSLLFILASSRAAWQ